MANNFALLRGSVLGGYVAAFAKESKWPTLRTRMTSVPKMGVKSLTSAVLPGQTREFQSRSRLWQFLSSHLVKPSLRAPDGHVRIVLIAEHRCVRSTHPNACLNNHPPTCLLACWDQRSVLDRRSAADACAGGHPQGQDGTNQGARRDGTRDPRYVSVLMRYGIAVRQGYQSERLAAHRFFFPRKQAITPASRSRRGRLLHP